MNNMNNEKAYKKTYSIYGIPMAKKLLQKGFTIVDVKINEKSGAIQFFFEQTDDFTKFMDLYLALKNFHK